MQSFFSRVMHAYHSTKFPIYSARISEDLVARLKSHEDVDDVELDVLATNQSSSSEDALPDAMLDDVVSLEQKRLFRHLGLETTPSKQPSDTVPSLFFHRVCPELYKWCEMPTSRL